MDWIKVTPETMPHEFTTCIITIEIGYEWEPPRKVTDVAQYRPGEGYLDGCWDTFNDWDEGQQNIKVTHWMCLPEPAED